jgi:hypothetical protein
MTCKETLFVDYLLEFYGKGRHLHGSRGVVPRPHDPR